MSYEKCAIDEVKESMEWLGEMCDEDAEMILEKNDEYYDIHQKWMENSEGLEFDDYVLKHRGYLFNENFVV